ncbi:hypothetical protein [uncultured Marivita sp.]|uniref:hypothetical protein n=1 Tax=uncultured Marivita sp. TaxID=888080 RepID=UPI0025CC0DA8|nr:hypothetical protein [uncultured Marivita sp.]
MAQSFDILGGQYLEMIEALRRSFNENPQGLLEVTLTGTLKNKSKSVSIGIQTQAPYYVKVINGHRLSEVEESYARKPLPHPFNLTHIHGARLSNLLSGNSSESGSCLLAFPLDVGLRV